MTDIPNETMHERRAMLYIKQVNDELDQEKPANISTLSEESNWDSKYFTRSWKKLVPKNLVKREKDGVSTRLELTKAGRKYVDLMLDMNKVLN